MGVAAVMMDCTTERSGRARARAAFLLAQLAAPPSTVAGKLAARIKKEKDELAKASLLLALGEIGRKSGDRSGTDVVDKATGDDSERPPRPAPPPVRVAAIVALAWMNPLYLSPSMVAFLKQSTALQVDPRGMPWNAGDLGGIAALVLPSTEVLDLEAALAAIEVLIEAHPPRPHAR